MLVAASAGVAGASHFSRPFLSHLHTVTTVASTVPTNGDVNPYGIATVPETVGALVRGDTLISNFNASSNLQGTGTTIVEISPSGTQSVFAQLDGPLPGPCPGGVGLTTALAVLRDGYVVVGSLPVTNGGTGTPEAGCLIVLDSHGQAVETWSGPDINGPWDMTADVGWNTTQLYVTNVLNNTVAAGGAEVSDGTVVRLDVTQWPNHAPRLRDVKVIGSGFAEQLSAAAVVLGPTGVTLGHDGTLYVADTVNSRIAVIPDAGFRHRALGGGGFTVTSGGLLESPLGLTTAPNGDVIAVNGGNGNAVEITPWGHQLVATQIDPAGSAGDLFGLTITPNGRGLLFVDDGDNTLKLFS
jgi:sugar lactone lactonase YvrE